MNYYVAGDRLLGLTSDKAEIVLEKYNLAERKSEPAILFALKDLQTYSIMSYQFDERNMYMLTNENKTTSQVIIVDLHQVTLFIKERLRQRVQMQRKKSGLISCMYSICK